MKKTLFLLALIFIPFGNVFAGGPCCNYIVFPDKVLCGYDYIPPASGRIAGGGWWLLDDADPESFQHLEKPYGADKNNVYKFCEKIEVDKETFEYNGWHYSKNKNGEYFLENANTPKEQEECIIPSVDFIDQESFECLGSGYFKDKNAVYFNPVYFRVNDPNYLKEVKDADVESFHVQAGYGVDKNMIYIDEIKSYQLQKRNFIIFLSWFGGILFIGLITFFIWKKYRKKKNS
jgi:hypothetical protein